MVVLFALAIFLAALIWYKFNQTDHWTARGVKHVDNKTIAGVLWGLLLGDPLPVVYKKVYDSYNAPYVGVYVGTRPALLLKDLENIKAVLMSDFVKFNSRGIITNPNDVLAGNILFLGDYKKWKLIRQKLTPVFTSAKLKNMFYIIERCASDFVDYIAKDNNLQKAPSHLLCNYTTASVASAVFGIDACNIHTMDSKFTEIAKDTITPNIKTGFIFYISSTLPKLFYFLDLQPFSKHAEFFVGAVKNMFKLRETNDEKKYDFIEICLDIKRNGMMKDAQSTYEIKPTDELLAAQAFFFFLAGIETTSNVMHYALIELANHRDNLEKLHKEIDRVFDECNDKILYDDIGKMKYLEMVMSETLRLYPPAGVLQRQCNTSTVLPVGGLKVEKGDLVIVPIHGLQRDKKYFNDPEEFKPERFSDANVKDIVKCSYMPFGEGNRSCIGERFARLQVLTGLAWFLRRYTVISTNKTVKYERSFFGLRSPHEYFRIVSR